MAEELSVVGRRVNRVDALPKVLGTLKYVSDEKSKDMLVGKPLFTKHPHAIIKKVDVSKALALEGVVTVMTAADLPGKNIYGVIVPDKPVIADKKTRYEGDALALVAAINEEVAKKALELIEVELEPLPVFDDPFEAMKESAVHIHEEHPLKDKGNRTQSVIIKKGDTEKAFAEADIIIDNYYETPSAEHCYFEPDCCIAKPDLYTGGIDLYSPSQGVTGAKRILAPVFNLPHNKVRAHCTVAGGAFGGREDTAQDVCAMAGVLALKTKKTVIVEYSREETFRTTSKRHAAYIHHRLASTKDGKITAIEVETILNKGAYSSIGGGRNPMNAVIFRTAAKAGGAYNIPNVNVCSYAVFTNSPYSGAFRGFGALQANFGIECQMDELAKRVGVDPVEIRLRNMLKDGDSTITGQVMLESRGLGIEECLMKVTEKIGWYQPFDHGSGHIKRGRGIAASMYGTGAPYPWESATVWAIMETDGTISIQAGATEMGQGLNTALAQLAAETLGLDLEDVQVTCSDSAFPDAGFTVASRGATIVGNAVVDACLQIRQRLVAVAAAMLNESADNIKIENRLFYAKSAKEKSVRYETVTLKAFQTQVPLAACGFWAPPLQGVNPEDGQGDIHHTYSMGAHAIELEVDTETGVITLLRSVIACDVGKAINPALVEGQMEGAVAQSAGLALMEEPVMNNGVLENATFHNYLIPTVMDMPEIDTIIVEKNNELGPYGAKGVGEPPMLATAPAIRNALWDALGFKINRIPLTARNVLMEVKRNAESVEK